MRIVIISDWFSEQMGYAENCLPKALAALGHDVHVVTSNGQVYFTSPRYRDTYQPFLGPPIVPCGVKPLDGYTLHRLPHGVWRGRLRIEGLLGKLHALRPQVVQTFDCISLTTLEAAMAKPLCGYKLFLANHMLASVFPLAGRDAGGGKRLRWQLHAATVGRLVSRLSEKCYPATADAADIAGRFFGIEERKLSICSLGVDTDLFHPVASEADRELRRRLRRQLGFGSADVVCVYTGRFSADKHPQVLAEAIAGLVGQGEPFRGLFLGNGTRAEVEAIQRSPGCVVHPFVPFRDLPPIYRAADVGVWPKQESTSMLDAVACGIPIVISDRVVAVERVQGNGVTYSEGDPKDMMRALRSLQDGGRRRDLGNFGAARIAREQSWLSIASRRLADYQAAVMGR